MRSPRRSLLAALAILATAPLQAQNLLSNGTFDAGVSGWTALGSGTSFSFDGAVGSPAAGSAAATLTGAVGVSIDAPVAGQCVAIPGPGWYEGGGLCRLDSTSGSGFCRLTFDLYSDAACGAQVNTHWGSNVSGSSASWATTLTRFSIPAGVGSVRVRPTLSKESAAASVAAHFDSLYFRPQAKGDLDGDGQTDLLFSSSTSTAQGYWLMNGVTRLSTALFSPAPASADWRLAVVDDFGWDGRADLVFQNTTSGAVEFWFMSGGTRIGSPVPLPNPPAAAWRLVASAPLRPYSGSHFFWQNTATQKLSVWLMSGGTTPTGTKTPTPDHAVDANWSLVGVADFNGDEDADFLWYNATTDKIVLWFMDQNLVRTTGQFTNPPNAGDNNWNVLAAGDYGRGANGLPATKDIVWRNATSGNMVVWHMDHAGNRTSGLFTTPSAPAPNPTDWTIAGPR